jgi:hypothetical protein
MELLAQIHNQWSRASHPHVRCLTEDFSKRADIRNPRTTRSVHTRLACASRLFDFKAAAGVADYITGLAKEAENLNILFYFGRYHPEVSSFQAQPSFFRTCVWQFGSIFAMGDMLSLIKAEDADVCVLEEPEHLNWFVFTYRSVDVHFTVRTRFRASQEAWTDKFKHVVGVVHTNYLSYSRTQAAGLIKQPLLFLINQWMCRSYCHKIIKLSGALQVCSLIQQLTWMFLFSYAYLYACRPLPPRKRKCVTYTV